MVQALLSAVAGIRVGQIDMNNTSADLANLKTTAYKGTRVIFQDMLAQTIKGATRPTDTSGGMNAIQYGLGVLVAGTDVSQREGGLNATGRNLDIALDGTETFLLLGDGQSVSYTQDGALDLDSKKNLVHRASGHRILGRMADSLGVIDPDEPITNSSFIEIPVGSLKAAQVTSKVHVSGNLNEKSLATDEIPSKEVVFDGIGDRHDVKFVFKNRQAPPQGNAPADLNDDSKNAVVSWDWEAYELSTLANGTVQETLIGQSSNDTTVGHENNQRLYFNNKGHVINTDAKGTMTVPSTDNTAEFKIEIDFTDITQLAADSQLHAKHEDGFEPGSLKSFNVMPDGIIMGTFTTGLTKPLAQIATSNFSNPGGLLRVGSNRWEATDNSGDPAIGVAGKSGRGKINSGFLKQSNVDISDKFSNMIITTRTMQANSRVATTVDEILREIINIKAR